MAGFKPNIDFDLHMERAVLGICLMEPNAFGTVYNLLSVECFYDHSHALVYNALMEVFTNGYAIDLLTVNRHMCDNGHPEINFEPAHYYLSQLCNGVVSSAHLETWCMFLRELAARREIIIITNSGFNNADVLAGAADIEERLRKIMDVRVSDDWLHVSQVAIKQSNHMDEVKDKQVGVTTGIYILDTINGGFKPGDMIVIGARPAVGKSAYMGRIAVRAAHAGANVGIISLEMDDRSVFARMVSAESRIDYRSIDRNDIAEEMNRKQVYSTMATLSGLPIYFSDTAQVNIADIRAKASKLKRKHGLDLLIIDYLQLVEPENEKNRNREQEVSKISRGVKLLAMTLKIPVIILAQLNRQVTGKGESAHPQLHHLRESGAIEQDADVVMFLHRDWLIEGRDKDSHGNSTEHQADLFIRKWRNGTTMDIKLGFEGKSMRFYDPEEEQSRYNPFAGMENVRLPYKDDKETF